MICAAVMAIGAAAYAANEITAQVALKVVTGYYDQTRAVNASWSIATTNPNVAGGTQAIGTNAAELVTIGDVTTKGWSYFRNLGTMTNVIALGVVDASTNFLEFARLEMGEYGVIRLGTNSIYAISIGAGEAATVLEKLIVDD
jgi:hypothetical protein